MDAPTAPQLPTPPTPHHWPGHAQGHQPSRPPSHPGGHPPSHPHGAWAHPAPRRSRLPSTAEALGWGGGLTTVVGVVAVTWDFWSTISEVALVLLLVAATAVLGVAAGVVGSLDRDGDDQLASNLSTALWWMAGIAATATCYIATDVVSGGRAFLALLAASLATTAMAGAAAYRTGRDSAAAGAVVSSAVAAFAAASLLDLDPSLRAGAIAVVGLCSAGGLLVGSRLLGERQQGSRISWAVTMVVLLCSSQAVVLDGPRLLLVGPIVVGLVVVAVASLVHRTRGEAVTACLLAGLLTCQTAYEIAPGIINLSTTVLLSGVLMTAGCIWLVRRAGGDG